MLRLISKPPIHSVLLFEVYEDIEIVLIGTSGQGLVFV